MLRPRVIPVLLLRDAALVKSIQFKNYKYLGDPINAVKIFNNLKVDELILLDIGATKTKSCIPISFVQEVGEEACMPFAAGGGICSVQEVGNIIRAGAEKVIIGSAAVTNPLLIKEASEEYGSSAISVCVDAGKDFWGKSRAYIRNGKLASQYSPVDLAKFMEDMGAGEIIIQSIARDGMMGGYDIELIRSISESVRIPVVALGGAGILKHMITANKEGYANGLAAGSMFVYHGSKKGVLINYPERLDLKF